MVCHPFRRLKWKPPSENSVDFKLELRFPPSKTHPDGLDYYAKPTFALLAWAGGNKYDYFDTMQISDDEWERYVLINSLNPGPKNIQLMFSVSLSRRMKETGDQFDDRVVEVVWNFTESNWKILRFRDDKKHGNHRDVVSSVIESIQDGVEMDAVSVVNWARSLVEGMTDALVRSSSRGRQPFALLGNNGRAVEATLHPTRLPLPRGQVSLLLRYLQHPHLSRPPNCVGVLSLRTSTGE